MLERLQSYDFGRLEAFVVNHAPALVAAAFLALTLVALVVVVGAVARSRRRSAEMEFAELKGRLSAMAELAAQQSSDQARNLNERIDTLARHLSHTLDTNAARLGDNLSEAGRRTSETLSTLNERLVLIDEAKRSLTELSSEVGSLHGVLANKQARGAFGQMRMETIVRDALPAGAYEFQPTLSNGKRPDCVIRLPNAHAALVIDSKFPLEGFEALRVAQTADETKLASAAIREAVGRHVAAIADKYLIPGETQETALMFVPSESICGDLFEKFPDLVQGSHRARVMIVAPNTLMLAVQTVQALLKDAKMRDHADIIQREVTLLLGDVAQLVDRVADLERHFGLSGKSLEKVSAAAGRILGRRQKLTSLDLDAMQRSDADVVVLPDAEAPLEGKRRLGR
jgi:DNA recombination protein RmuC